MASIPAGTRGRRTLLPGAAVSASQAPGFVSFAGRGDIQPQLDSALHDVNDKYLLLEETEKQAVRKALIEERGRFCTFISMLRPVIVSQWKVPEGLNCQFRGDPPCLSGGIEKPPCVRNHDGGVTFMNQ